MKFSFVKGSTSLILTVLIQDSTKTDGAGLAGLDETDSIVGGYVRMGGTGVALAVDEDVDTEGTYEAPSTVAHVRIGTPANMTAGTYELHFHNDLFAAGARSVSITLSGAANMAVLPIEVQLTTFDLDSANPDVNVKQISGDDTAADNLELQYDTTGLTGDTFPATQAQLGNLTSGSAAISVTAESFEKSAAEPETNTFTATRSEDLVYHIVQDDGGDTDAYYEFNVGGNGVPVSVTWWGYAQSNGDSYSIWAYNYGTPGYEQIGSLVAVNGTTPRTETFDLSNAHVGAGDDLGKVRFRFLSADGTAFATDRLLCSFSVVSQSVGYADGAIWVDTLAGTAGTETYVNGTADNPVNTWADALTISENLGVTRFHIINGSTITLSDDSDNFTLIGNVWTLVLDGQLVEGIHCDGAAVSGIGTGSGADPSFENCHMGDVTLPPSHLCRCGLGGTFTAGSAGDFFFDSCHSAVAGTSAPVFDFGTGLNASDVNFRRYSGGIEIENMGAGAGSYTMSLEGHGQLVINANCSADSTVAIRGHFPVTDGASGAVTLSDTGRFASDDLVDDIWADGTAHPGVLVSTTIDGVTNQKVFTLIAGADFDDSLENQAIVLYDTSNSDFPSVRKIIAYTGATKTCEINEAPDFTIVGGDGVKVFVTAPGSTAPTVSETADAVWDEARADHTDAGSFGAALQPLYTARIHLQIDDDNTVDRYLVRWYLNGLRITSGITNPKITVTDGTDGSVLVNDEDMSDVDGGETLLYAENTDRVALGTPYEALVEATIDGATRTDSDNTGRDI